MDTYAPVSAAEHIYRGVRQLILEGELLPGQRLVQREIAQKFGTSNIPVIEAIRRLEQDGLVYSRPNAGAQVATWSTRDVMASFLIREALEGVAARLWVEVSTPEDHRELRRLEKEFRAGVQARDRQRFVEADMALHAHIVNSTGNSPLIRAFSSSATLVVTLAQCGVQLEEGGVRREPITPAGNAHRELLAALLDRDADAAEAAARGHVHEAMERVRQLWDQS